MVDSLTGLLDPTRILFELQQGNDIAQSFSGLLEPEAIARCVTDGLVEKFDCAFTRLWLLESDPTVLRLVASSGLYTHTNGSFSRVPVGAYKVGKIAQNRVSFLSNNLAEEPWVGDRAWAKANNINGFAGYPLQVQERLVGVLAAFSHQRMEPEFLEVLQTLCTIVAVALDTALQYQKEKQKWQVQSAIVGQPFLSDHLVTIFSSTRLTLIGTERTIPASITYLVLQTAEFLKQLGCSYCRLVYGQDSVALEAIVPTTQTTSPTLETEIQSQLGLLQFSVTHLGGRLQTQTSANQRAIQIVLTLPDSLRRSTQHIQIRCRAPLLQLAFTQLAILAGLQVNNTLHHISNQNLENENLGDAVPLLTDDPTQISTAQPVLWVQQGNQPAPRGIAACLDLHTTPDQLQQAVAAVVQGERWNVTIAEPSPGLSEREIEILTLLTQGHRDRDIADRLVISESTVKFHMNNALSKLKVRTRYQAIHQAITNRWIE